MISICTVSFGKTNDYFPVFTDSIRRFTKHVTEVIVVKIDSQSEGLIKVVKYNHIEFKFFGYNLLQHIQGYQSPAWAYMVCGHALGLHHALECSTQEYVWFSDPDLFFLTQVDELYLNLMKKCSLDIVGVSHFNAKGQSYEYFPCVINCMVRKDSLPNSDWLKDQLWIRSGMQVIENPQPLIKTEGKYLVSFPIPEHQNRFPNPQGMFDTGCNLWLWNLERNGRWLSFYLDQWHTAFQYNRGFAKILYPLNYNTARYKTNFGLEENLGKQDLLFHRTRGTLEAGQSFRNIYESIFHPRTRVNTPRPQRVPRTQQVYRSQRPGRGYIR